MSEWEQLIYHWGQSIPRTRLTRTDEVAKKHRKSIRATANYFWIIAVDEPDLMGAFAKDRDSVWVYRKVGST